MNSTLGSRPYWCISRQRSWGLPIPCLYTKKNGQETEVITRELIENLKSLIFKEGNVNFWWTNKYDDKLFQGVEDSSEVQKSMDILDIWFDSGSSFNSVLSKFLSILSYSIIYTLHIIKTYQFDKFGWY